MSSFILAATAVGIVLSIGVTWFALWLLDVMRALNEIGETKR